MSFARWPEISVFYARRTGSPSLSSAQSCIILYYIILYYILTRFIAKSNAFLKFYRKNQCVSLFEIKTKVFSQTTNQVLPTSCRVQVWTYSSSLLPKKNRFSTNIFGDFSKIFLRESLYFHNVILYCISLMNLSTI